MIVSASNPKHIYSLEDLTRENITFDNRQAGAGTRVLLDYHMGQLRMKPSSIIGYDLQEYTHLDVAVAVASGRADCGLGIASAALAMNLDFIHLYEEEYELIFTTEGRQEELVQPFLELANEEAFITAICSLPGYDLSHMGEVRVIEAVTERV